MPRPSQIVALGGGGFSMEPENPLLDRYILGLAGVDRPRVCFLPTASGDSDNYIVRFYRAFNALACEPSHLALVNRTVVDLEGLLLQQDVVYVGGGNTANMLAVWRVHGMDVALRRAWDAGVVLCGISAGMICWFEGGVTDSFGPLAPLEDGLRFLTGTACPHYDGETNRRPTYHRLIAEGTLAPGWAAADGVGLHFVGTELRHVVASRPRARAYRVELREGHAVEREVVPHFLG